MSWLDAGRTRLRLLFSRAATESRMEEEIRFHLEMEAARLEREEGLSAAEARQRAHVTFGGVDRAREALRDGHGLPWLSGLRLDLKLGVRMLVKQPVLTLASVVALAVAVALAASWFEFMTGNLGPRLALPAADRLVHVQNMDAGTGAPERPALHDYEAWRDGLGTIEELSAASPAEYTLITEDGRYATLQGVRATPSLFVLLGVPPLLGRTIGADDALPGAPPVVVLGHDAWQRLFDGDASAVGRTVRLGAGHATIIGVMPPRFAFPVNHELWTPLHANALAYERGAGPPLRVFGRLAPGASLARANAELTAAGERAAAAYPDTHAQLRPEARRYPMPNDMAVVTAALNLPFLLFLLVVSVNLAALLFARTVSRESEIVLRSALGASRRRLVAQLVAEALVLTALGAALGLAVAAYGFGRAMDVFWEVQQMRPPFWFDGSLSGTTVLYAALLAVVGALVIGGVPALRATGTQLRARLPQPGAIGGMGFGRFATAVIVVQVALCVAFLPFAILNARDLLAERGGTGFPADEFLTGRLTLQHEPATPSGGALPARQPDALRAELFGDVLRRLAAQPGVLAATRASRIPGFNHAPEPVQLDDDSATVVYARRVAVDPDFLSVMDARVVSGRGLTEADVTDARDVLVVDEAWARRTFGDRNAVGRRIRLVEAPGGQPERWHEVVGVVAGSERAVGPGSSVSLFAPLRPDAHAGVQFYLRTARMPAAVAPEVHMLITATDPLLAVAALQPLDEVWRPVERADAFFASALAAVGAIIVGFVLIGTYALMSHAVAQRTREIGIRSALGADRRRIIVAIFARAARQIGAGLLAGGILVSLAFARSPDGVRLVAAVAAGVALVGLLGCLIPAARALRVQPTEALRME
jgi:putative ABC transport system permease protein